MAEKKRKATKRRAKKKKPPIEVEIERLTRTKKQAQFIEVFFSTSNNVSQTCMAIGIDRGTYYDWVHNDNPFKKRIDDQLEKMKDYAESMIIKAMPDDWRAAVAWLKVKAKDRGWKPDIALAAEEAPQTEEIIIRHVYDQIPKKQHKQIESKEVTDETTH